MSKSSLSSIQTVSQLYKSGQLKAAASSSQHASYPSSIAERVALTKGDITKLDVDAIVNAANKSLLGGGGVDGAIHRAAGKELLEECRKLNGCETGDAKVTKGYNLPASFVVHTVGPVYAKTKVEEKKAQLESAYRRSLEEASKAGSSSSGSSSSSKPVRSIAFPSISTGVYGYPMQDATDVAINTVAGFLQSSEGKDIEKVVFCTFSDGDHQVYLDRLPLFFQE